MTNEAEYMLIYNGRAGGREGWFVDFRLAVDGKPVGNNMQVRVGFGKLMDDNDKPPFRSLGEAAWVSGRDPLARHPDLCSRLIDQLAEQMVAFQHASAWDEVEGIALTARGPAVLRP